jgi:hypothetical protein
MNAEDNEGFDFNFDELNDEDRAELEEQQREEEIRLNKHPLFKQAHEINKVLDLVLESFYNPEEKELFGTTLKNSALTIITKLSSGLTSDSYGYCMQKAAVIREHGEYLRLSNHLLSSRKSCETRYIDLFREEMDQFHHLFKNWAKEILTMKDDFEDEWGLFVK